MLFIDCVRVHLKRDGGASKKGALPAWRALAAIAGRPASCFPAGRNRLQDRVELEAGPTKQGWNV
jgi:hypothetical protein